MSDYIKKYKEEVRIFLDQMTERNVEVLFRGETLNEETQEMELSYTSDKAAIIIQPHLKRISVAFLAITKPEDAASLILDLQDVEWVDEFELMESFMFDENKTLIWGDKAHDFVKEKIIFAGIKAAENYRKYEDYLKNIDASKLPSC